MGISSKRSMVLVYFLCISYIFSIISIEFCKFGTFKFHVWCKLCNIWDFINFQIEFQRFQIEFLHFGQIEFLLKRSKKSPAVTLADLTFATHEVIVPMYSKYLVCNSRVGKHLTLQDSTRQASSEFGNHDYSLLESLKEAAPSKK